MPKILLIDDEIDLVEILKLRLEANDYEVIVATDGEEGLRKAREESPDIIILDLMLPKIDGYKVCGILKFDSKYREIPVIMLTARVREEDKKLGKEAKADAYITKPFDPQNLLDEIEKLLKK